MTVLLLDVMGTLVYDPFHEEMPRFFGMSLQQLLAEKDPDAWVEFERGAIDEDTFMARFFADGRGFDRHAFREHVRRAYRWIPGMPRLLEELRDGGVEMHALSNYPQWYRLIERQLSLSRLVRWSFVSCETGLRKPDDGAFLHAARALRRDPERCLFVDDRPINCEAARQCGMDAIEFQDATALRAALGQRGLIAPR